MTTEHNPSQPIHLATGNEALAIVNRCRKNVGERFEVQPLDDEFPAFTQRLGANGLYLAEADNNPHGTARWRGDCIAAQWHTAHPASLLPPAFDELCDIRGQGTIVDEILDRLPEVKVIVGPADSENLTVGSLQRLDELEKTDVQYYAAKPVGSNRIGNHASQTCQRMENFHTLTVSDEEADDLVTEYLYDHTMLLRSSEPKDASTCLAIAALRQVVTLHPGAVIAVISTGHNASSHRDQSRTPPTNVWSSPFPK